MPINRYNYMRVDIKLVLKISRFIRDQSLAELNTDFRPLM